MTARLADWLEAPAGWAAIAGALALVFALFVAPLLLGPHLYVAVMPHDTLSMADIGYRMARGQVPGRDFHSAFGVVFQWQMGAAWRLTGTAAGALKAATALFFAALAAFGAYVARTRLSNLTALAFLPTAVLLGCTPFASADEVISGVTYAMLYNREAWVVLLLALMFWLEPRRPVRAWAEAAALGLLVAACLYFKLSYGGMALAFLGLLALCRPAGRGVALGALGVTAAFVLALEAIYGLGFNAAYLADVALVARSGGGRIAHILVNLYLARGELIGACLFAPLFAFALRRRVLAVDLLFLAFCAAAGLLIVWQNAQVNGLATLWAGVFALLDRPREPAGPGRTDPALVLPAGLVYAGYGALALAPVLVAAAQADIGAFRAPPPLLASVPAFAQIRFAAPPEVKRLHLTGLVYGDDYARAVNDGLALLAACPAGRPLAVFDMFDPFTEAQARAPNHGWSWRHFGHAFSLAHHPQAEPEFRGVDCIMIPATPANPDTTAALMTLYRPYLDAHFAAERRSSGWTLRLRTAP